MPPESKLPPTIAPRGLDIEQAAEYCGVSRNHLMRHGPQPTRIGERNVYDRKVLDLWLDQLAGLGPSSRPQRTILDAINDRKNALRNPAS